MISRLFLVMGFKGISDKASTVTCAPSRLPSSLVTFFNCSDILLKAFIMFIANWTDIVVYKDQIWMKKIKFEWLIASHFMVAVQHFLFSGMAADLFLIREYSVTSTKSFHDCFSIWLGAYVKHESSIRFLMSGSANTPFSLRPGLRNWTAEPSFLNRFPNFLMSPNLMYKGREII